MLHFELGTVKFSLPRKYKKQIRGMIQIDNDDFTIISINKNINLFLTLKMNMS